MYRRDRAQVVLYIYYFVGGDHPAGLRVRRRRRRRFIYYAFTER